MKIAFYGTKPYDKIWFEPMAKEYGFEIRFIDLPCNEETVFLSKGYDAICIFVNDYVNAKMIDQLYEMKVKAILLRSAGFNHVDVKAAEDKIVILRVPSYSPEAVAEFAMSLLLTVNRHTNRAYNRTRDFNMSLNGLMGSDLNHKVAGVVGTGKIGQAMIRILNGFQMQVLAYDPYPAKGLEAEYVSIEELMSRSDVISLHCPLTSETEHIVKKETIAMMKQGVYLINTSRGALIDTDALIDGLLQKKFGQTDDISQCAYHIPYGIFHFRSNESHCHGDIGKCLCIGKRAAVGEPCGCGSGCVMFGWCACCGRFPVTHCFFL